MNATRIGKIGILAILLALAGISCSSVYFNTFFNAKKAFNEAEKKREDSDSRSIDKGLYQTAIEKSLKVVEEHPKSKFYDDALYVLGVSYFYTGEYGKAERRFREILANYEDSKFAERSSVYLAKSKLQLGEIDDAMQVFEEIFNKDYDRKYKAEAALGLGDYYFNDLAYDRAQNYFKAVRDSLGDDIQKRRAQLYIADAYFQKYKFADALNAYLQVLGMEPDIDQKYRALYQSAISSFRLQRIEAGMDYLDRLINDETYFDSLGVLKLRVAEGYEYDGDLDLAEDTYRDVSESAQRPIVKAEAYYRLALIYQFDYDKLEQAKEFYDKSVEANRSAPFAQDALQRSSDIGKLKTFTEEIKVDTATTQASIDEAAYTQYLLAELYWFKLNKPDSAMYELRYLIDSFPTSYDAPNAMIALSEMIREQEADTAAADSILHEALAKYPHSDFVPTALERLELKGTEADTGYAAMYMHRAEDFILNEDNADSARFYYQYVVDNFPDSKYFVQAKFNLIWLEENYFSPGDSSVIYAYNEFADSFPGTNLAEVARQRVSGQSGLPSNLVNQQQPQEEPVADTSEALAAAQQAEEEAGQAAGSGSYDSYLKNLYISPEGDTIILLDEQPIEVIEPFEFPTEASGMQENDIYLYFQVLVDFSGKVVDVVQKTQSQYEEINDRAKRAVASMTFDAGNLSTQISILGLPPSRDNRGHWFVYKFLVQKPDYLR
jgi:tetratricopeptide (TPR) repeat protein